MVSNALGIFEPKTPPTSLKSKSNPKIDQKVGLPNFVNLAIKPFGKIKRMQKNDLKIFFLLGDTAATVRVQPNFPIVILSPLLTGLNRA